MRNQVYVSLTSIQHKSVRYYPGSVVQLTKEDFDADPGWRSRVRPATREESRVSLLSGKQKDLAAAAAQLEGGRRHRAGLEARRQDATELVAQLDGEISKSSEQVTRLEQHEQRVRLELQDLEREVELDLDSLESEAAFP